MINPDTSRVQTFSILEKIVHLYPNMECIYCPVQNRNRSICIRKLNNLSVTIESNLRMSQWDKTLWHEYLNYDYRTHTLNICQLMCFAGFAMLAFKHRRLTVVLYDRREERRCICCLWLLVAGFPCISFIRWNTMKCTSLCIVMSQIYIHIKYKREPREGESLSQVTMETQSSISKVMWTRETRHPLDPP